MISDTIFVDSEHGYDQTGEINNLNRPFKQLMLDIWLFQIEQYRVIFLYPLVNI